ncbi:TetR/AcrR family transcriptional regulator [Fulvivirgaceae bacterium BMA12]|uniref:TetR/AcrR family transcriptional regulator n=1 Tax=Agaribacillus aureus TaxID=3051825 RepID=A0ABT8L793_9BACT|nr:TetR/AcrR family transcriptional regulator [Fulvivirgaceae bacterium BMA12]
MKNKEIQEQRMKGYFIQATKEILKGEGIQNLSVRNIADQAGYSYATLYNYFKDINDLLFYCINDFQEECQLFTEEHTQKELKGIERLKATVLAYMRYFIEYPGIFDLFYLVKMDGLGNKASTIHVINNSLENVCAYDWDYCLSHGIIQPAEMEVLKTQLKYTVTGLLLFYLNRISPESYPEFIENSSNQISHVLNSK